MGGGHSLFCVSSCSSPTGLPTMASFGFWGIGGLQNNTNWHTKSQCGALYSGRITLWQTTYTFISTIHVMPLVCILGNFVLEYMYCITFIDLKFFKPYLLHNYIWQPSRPHNWIFKLVPTSLYYLRGRAMSPHIWFFSVPPLIEFFI